MGDRQER